MSTDLSIYGQTAPSVALSIDNFVLGSDGLKHYVPLGDGPLGDNSLYAGITILGVGRAIGADANLAHGIPGGETYRDVASAAVQTRLLVDTGSWATVIPLAKVTAADPTFDVTGYPAATIQYSSSLNTITGVWVPMRLQLATTDGSTAITTIPVLVDTRDDPAYMMGVGFDVARGDATNLPAITTANNAFLNLAAMRDGAMVQGYVIDRTGIHLGLTETSVGSGWAYEKLQPSQRTAPPGAPIDWLPSTISGTVGTGAVPAGNLLMDTGLYNSYVKTTVALPQPPPGTPVTLNLLGTNGAVGYSYILDGNSAMAPSAGSLSAALQTGTSDTGTFVNTGEHFLSGFDYLYDATNGFLGVRQNQSGANTDTVLSQLVSVDGPLTLPDNFATALPFFLQGDTSLTLAGSATLSGGLSGTGQLNVAAGTLNLSGPSTWQGTASSDGPTAVLHVLDAASLGGAANTVLVSAGGTLDLAPGVTLGQTLVLPGSGTITVASGTATIAGAIQVLGDDSAALLVAGGGTLALSGKIPDHFGAITVRGSGTTLSFAGKNGHPPAVTLESGTALRLTGSAEISALTTAGDSTIDVPAGMTLTVDDHFRLPGEATTIGHVAITGGGTLHLANGSGHDVPLATDARLTVGTSALLDGTFLTRFQPGDLIDVTNLPLHDASVTARYDAGSGQLVLSSNGAQVARIGLPGAPAAGSIVTVTTDGGAGTLIGLTTATGSGGDVAMRGQAARALGVDGTGIVVGVISDSFNSLGGMAQDILNQELPQQTRVLSDPTNPHSDEGREMAQLVHKIAPGASILFATADTATDPLTGATSADQEQRFANAINLLVSNGARIVVDDERIYEESYWQPGGIASQAIAAATAQGVVFVTSAGNSGRAYYEQTLTLAQAALPGGSAETVYDFARGQGTPRFLQHVSTQTSSHTLDLQWALPQGNAAFALSLHIYKMDSSGTYTEVTTSLAKPSTDTSQTIRFDDARDFYVAVTSNTPAATGLFKYIVLNEGQAVIDDPLAGRGSGTIYGHKLDANEITVGAVDYQTAPANGGTPVSEPYSAYGPGEYLFDAAGNRLPTPLVVGKPDVSGVDKVATDVSGSSTPFGGTSAAAPSVAAVVALMLQRNGALTTPQVRSILAASAVPMPGATLTAGAGLVQADVAVTLSLPPALNTIAAAADGPGTVFGVGHSIQFVLTGTTALVVTPGPGGVNPVLLLNDGAVAAYDPTASAGGTPTFRTTIAAGQSASNLTATQIVLNGAVIANAGGLALTALDLTGIAGATTGLTIETVPPPVTISLTAEGTPGVSTPIVAGVSEAGASITVSTGSTVLGAVAANADGTWSLSLPRLPDGSALLSATATDPAGNRAVAQLSVSFANGAAGTVRQASSGQVLRAGNGPDTLVAAGDGVLLLGGAGPAQLVGSATGSATMLGGSGNTSFVARGGPTLIQGGSGQDTVTASLGNATVISGRGGTFASFSGGPVIYSGQGSDTVVAGTGASTIGVTGSSLVALGTGQALVAAGSGSTVVGGAGSNLVGVQGAGATFFGGAGQNLFIGGSGSSLVVGGSGSSTVLGGAGGGVFAGGGGGGNVMVAGQAATTLFGGGSGDVLFATGSSSHVLVAGSGNVTLQGGGATGDNTYFAGSGNAVIGLGAGREVVFAGSGASTVIGGTGVDTYAVTKGAAGGSQTILGFKLGTDHVSLQGYGNTEASQALANASSAGGSTTVTLSDATRITFAGLNGIDGRVFG